MATSLNDNINTLAPKPIDSRYFHPDNRPWLSVNEANNSISLTVRYPNMSISVDGVEYWYKGGVENEFLTKKEGSHWEESEW